MTHYRNILTDNFGRVFAFGFNPKGYDGAHHKTFNISAQNIHSGIPFFKSQHMKLSYTINLLKEEFPEKKQAKVKREVVLNIDAFSAKVTFWASKFFFSCL